MSQRISLIAICLLLVCSSQSEAGQKRFIIGFKQIPGLTELEKQDRVHRAGGRVKRRHTVINAVTADLPEEQAEGFKQDPRVAYIEEDRVFFVEQPVTTSAEYADSWGVQHIGADLANRNGNKGAGVKVAILDSGIDYNHPDLKDNYRGGYNFAYENDDPFDDSISGHGTHVAGIIAARDNGTGVVGVAPEASIYAVKVLEYSMMGSMSDILAGLEWAITNNMNVINMSFGIPNDPIFFSQAIKDACDKAYQAGIVLVAAAGNGRQPVVDFPADFDSVIAIAATDKDDAQYVRSNYGAKVELAAPGVDVKSTVPGGGYALLSGTSQAAPHAAGVVALLLSSELQNPDPARNLVDQVRSRLAAGARDLGEPGRDIYFGFGLVAAPGGQQANDLTVIRTQGRPKEDALAVSVNPGAHTIKVVNRGLRNLVMRTPRGTEVIALMKHRQDRKASTEAVSFSYYADEKSTLTFYPHGRHGASAQISISGN